MNNFNTNACCNPNPCCDPCSFPVNRSSGFAFVLVLFILLAIVGAAWF